MIFDRRGNKDPIAPVEVQEVAQPIQPDPENPNRAMQKEFASVNLKEEVPPTRFSDQSMQEYQYNDTVAQVFHLIGFDDTHLRTATIRASHKNEQIGLAHNIGAIENGRVPHAFIASFHAVPIQYMTHLTYSAHSSEWPLQVRLWHWFVWFWGTVYANMVLIPAALMLVSLIICFYVPTYMDNGELYNAGAVLGYNATLAIFLLTLVALVVHICLLVVTFRDQDANRMVQVSEILSLIALIISFCLAIYLLTIVSNNYDGSSTGNGNSDSGLDWSKFMCDCPNSAQSEHVYPTHFPTHRPTLKPSLTPSANPSSAGPSANPTTSPTFAGFSPAPTVRPTYYPTELNYNQDYEYVCSNITFAAAEYKACGMNCGVCGNTYRDPFLSYVTFATVYELIIIFLVFVHFYIAYLHAYIVLPLLPPVVTGMYITLHGSTAFGYPLTTKLSVVDTIQAERQLNAIRKSIECDENRRGKDFLKHMMTASSAARPATIESGVANGVTFVIQALKMVLRIFGLA